MCTLYSEQLLCNSLFKYCTDKKLFKFYNILNRCIVPTANIKRHFAGIREVLDDTEEDNSTCKPLPPFNHAEDYEPKINQTFMSVKNRKMRYAKSLIMLEGRRLIEDALNSDLTPKMVLFTRQTPIADYKWPSYAYNEKNTIFYRAKYEYIQLWSDLTTSPGIIGIFNMPKVLSNKNPVGVAPVTVVCDNIREPGNLGSILRIAAAIPVSKVLIMKGCVDLWDSKVIRSSCGSHFKLPIEHNLDWSHLEDYTGHTFLADCLWASPEYDPQQEAISNTKKYKLYRDAINSVPVVPYNCVHYDKLSPIVLVIGGETEGLSNESLEFAHKTRGIRVNIPLSNYVDSLNSGVALGVLLFEIKRQLSSQLAKRD